MEGFEWLREEEDLNVKITDKLFERFQTFLEYNPNETLLETLARVAVWHDNPKLLRFVIDRGFNVRSILGRTLANRGSVLCDRVFLDAGLGLNIFNFYETTGMFFESRNLARSSAILTMYVTYRTDKKYKNVSIIIGRAIWESRGDCEKWLENEGV